MTKTPARLGGWDVHTHLIPAGVTQAAGRGAYGMALDDGKLEVCGHGVPLVRIADRAKLLERIESDGLDGAIVSVPPPLFRPDLDAETRRDYARFVNDALLDAVRDHKTTLRPLAYLPAEDPALACEIAGTLERSWAGVVVGTELAGRLYSQTEYHPLWDSLARRDLPVFLHPGSSTDIRLNAFYLTNLLGNPYETTLAAAHLIFGGVLNTNPELKIILAHGGGCAAALAGRWQRGAATDRPGIGDMALLPDDAMKRFYYDSLVHHPAYLDCLIETAGASRVLLGSDWPFPMGADHADHGLAHLTEATRLLIRKANAEQVFGNRLS